MVECRRLFASLAFPSWSAVLLRIAWIHPFASARFRPYPMVKIAPSYL
jgi:hypothetical protein